MNLSELDYMNYDDMVSVIGGRRIDFAKVYDALRQMGRRPWKQELGCKGIADGHDAARAILSGFDVFDTDRLISA